jgi:thioesterase domain-containing protein
MDILSYNAKSLAAHLEALADSLYEPEAICIRKRDATRPSLFLIHTFINCSDISLLIPHIAEDISVHLLLAETLISLGFRTIEGIAARMVQMIQAVQSDGPYCIAGYSAGGALASEVGAHLIGEDQDVAFVGLLESSYHQGLDLTQSNDSERTRRTENPLISISTETSLNSDSPPIIHDGEPGARASEITDGLNTYHEQTLLPSPCLQITGSHLRKSLTFERVYGEALKQYSAQYISIPIHVFVIQRNGHPISSCGWENILPSLQIRLIPVVGDHESMSSEASFASLGQSLSNEICKAVRDHPELPEKKYSPAMKLQTGQLQSQPVFCIPGAGDSVTSFIDVITHFGKLWTFYGLQPRGIDGLLSPHPTVSSAASFYLRNIDRIYFQEPIHLLGHSFGGWIAFEMANKLLQMGQKIGSLTILDSMAPDHSRKGPREASATDISMKWIESMELLLDRPLNIPRRLVESLDEPDQRHFLHSILIREKIIPKSSHSDILRGPLRTFAAGVRASYIPERIYSERLQLILVDHPNFDEQSNLQKQRETIEAWKRWAPSLTYARAPGNHITLLKSPNAEALARLLYIHWTRC